jgi:transcriptional regulator with XRE-family HTH domain
MRPEPAERTDREKEALRRVGKNIRLLRVEHDLPQDGLARDAGIERTHFSALEKGRHNPSLLTLLKVADALGVSLSYLLRGVGEADAQMRLPGDSDG